MKGTVELGREKETSLRKRYADGKSPIFSFPYIFSVHSLLSKIMLLVPAN